MLLLFQPGDEFDNFIFVEAHSVQNSVPAIKHKEFGAWFVGLYDHDVAALVARTGIHSSSMLGSVRYLFV